MYDRKTRNSPTSPTLSPNGIELRPSGRLQWLARAWLLLASAGCAAAAGASWPLRGLIIGVLWALGYPALRVAIDLAGPRALCRLWPAVRGPWRVASNAGAQWGALPAPSSGSLGDVVWLVFRAPDGRRAACLIDRNSTDARGGALLRAALRAGSMARRSPTANW